MYSRGKGKIEEKIEDKIKKYCTLLAPSDLLRRGALGVCVLFWLCAFASLELQNRLAMKIFIGCNR